MQHPTLILASALFSAAPSDKSVEVPLTIHVALKDGAHVASNEWIHAAEDEATRAFGSSGMRYRVKSVVPLRSPGPVIHTPAERHALAKHAPKDGSIHVFIVEHLADKQRRDKWIGGVHWRYVGKARRQRGRRYIIVSYKEGTVSTLAHELGHFFGLGHTTDPISLMTSPTRNKDAGFDEKQVARVRQRLRRSIRRRMVVPH